MKKRILAIIVTISMVTLTLTSCNLRSCYCCVLEGNDVHSNTTYTDIDRSCESLNTNTTKCMDEGAHLPCSSTAFDFKKR